ncbi:MAG TPA: hypothetical protein VFJ23_00670 [Candidatus Nitrosotalea sp.]|nr:hypothetical protein [Candidatus Nitrosotalea sp.]
MPREEYSTITIRTDTYEKFLKISRELKKKDYQMYHTQVLEFLIDTYQKSKKSI